jgi:iron complex outermembrane recepter protein
MMNNRSRLEQTVGALAVIAALQLMPAAALAQEAADNAATAETDDIIVTGERVNRNLQDVTSSVAVLTSDFLEENAIDSLTDALALTANVGGDAGNGNIVIRGVGTFGVSGLRGDSFNGQTSLANSIVVDEVVVPQVALDTGSTDIWDAGQIEIFRGPQSTNQGRNALSGGIVIRSQAPVHQLAGDFQFAYAEFDSTRVSGTVNVPVVVDEVAVRVSADYASTDGFVDLNRQTGERSADRDQSISLRGRMLFEPASIPSLRVLLSASYLDSVSRTLPQSLTNRRESSTGGDLDYVDLFTASARADLELGSNLTLTSISTLVDMSDFRPISDNDGSVADLGNVRSTVTQNDFSQELRLGYQRGGFRAIIGGYYYESDRTNPAIVLTRLGAFGAPPPLAALRLIFDLETDTNIRNHAVFGEIEIPLGEKVRVMLGARYDSERFDRVVEEDRSRSDPLAILVTQSLLPPFDQDIDTTFDAFLPKAALTVDWTDDFSTMVQVQRAYRGGGAGQLGQPPLGVDPRFAYGPEFTTTYELAFRSQWLDRRLTVNGNIFYTRWTDQQSAVTIFPFNPANVLVVNAARSRLYGAELEVRANINRNLLVFGTLGLLDTIFLDFDVRTALNGVGTTGGLFTGNQFPRAPRTSATIGASYRPDSGIFGSFTATYTSAQFGDVANTDVRRIGARTVVNAVLGYDFGPASIELFARNLFDEDYLIDTTLATDNATLLSGAVFGAPRVVGVRFRTGF